MTKEMTSGSPMRLILGFSVPLLFGFLFQQFYNLVDTMIVGKTLGVESLAAVGSTGSINFLVIGFCMGVCSGFSIPVSHKFGAGDYSGMRRYVANAMWIGIAFAVVLTVVTGIFCRSILILMRTPDNILEEAYIYIFIIFIGIPTVFLYNILSGVIRALGDSKTPVIFLLMSSVMNIALDLFLIIVMKMGVAGAALATVISQGVSGAACLVFMVRKFEILHIQRGEWGFDLHMAKTLCGMGVPMGLQYSITAIGSVILQSAANSLGSNAVASMTAATRINGFMACPFDALGSTMATYGGQNVGAGRIERLTPGLKDGSIIGVAYSLLAFIVMFIFGGQLAKLFVDGSEVQIIANVRQYILFNSAFFFLLVFVNNVRFMIQGIGFPTFAILAGVLEMIARTLTGLLIVPFLGFTGLCMGSPIAWLFADIFLIPAYIHSKKVLEKRWEKS